MINAARAVPSTIGGGDNGHIVLFESVPTYTTRTGRTGYTGAIHPVAIDFTGATANAHIAHVKEAHAMALETYNMQEGVRAGLRKIIIANVPVKLLVQHKDAESGLDEVEPRVLLETIEGRTPPITSVDAKTLKAARNAPLTFDMTKPLATQFALINKAIADLNHIHSITTSEFEIMMEWFTEIEKEKDFEDQVVAFRTRTTNNGFNGFITYFSERGVKVRRLNKLVQGRAEAAGYHSAANMKATNKYINNKVNAEIANLAAAIEAAMGATTLDSQRSYGPPNLRQQDGRERGRQSHLQQPRRHPCRPQSHQREP